MRVMTDEEMAALFNGGYGLLSPELGPDELTSEQKIELLRRYREDPPTNSPTAAGRAAGYLLPEDMTPKMIDRLRRQKQSQSPDK